MNSIVTFIKFEKNDETRFIEGKNSDVFLAKDTQLECNLIIKKIAKKNFNPDEYFREAQMMYKCKHINIAEIQYASQDEEFIYFAMPYYKNGSLNNLLQSKNLSIREIVKYSLELLSAVNFVHSNNLLHLDIKPTNILLDDSGNAILTDFGLSRYLSDDGFAIQPNIYEKIIDPEFFDSTKRSVQSDIYQIGLTMYRMCNGLGALNDSIQSIKDQAQKYALQIFESDKTKNLNEIYLKEFLNLYHKLIKSDNFPDKNKFLPHIPSKLKSIILKALKINPEERYANTIDFMNDLTKIDSNLDCKLLEGQPEKYLIQAGGFVYNIIVEDNSITTTKTNVITNRTETQHKYCVTFTNVNDKNVQLRKIFKEIN